MEGWQRGFSDHRGRDAADCRQHVLYIQQNPVRKHLCERAEGYPYSSASIGVELDPVPQGLKPVLDEGLSGAAEAAPFQDNPFQCQSLQPTSAHSKPPVTIE